VKLSDCYDTTYTIRGFGRADKIRPAITAKRAREIFAAAERKMDPTKLSTLNKSLTVGKAFEVLSQAITSEMPDETALHSLISRNIVREFGKFLDSPKAKQIKSLMEDSGYTRSEAKILADAGFSELDPPRAPGELHAPGDAGLSRRRAEWRDRNWMP
jgi:S-adenosylmethionine synthetase